MKFQNNSEPQYQKQQFFNQSFYNQKITQPNKAQTNENTYVSYEYTKKYFQATRINELINKTVKTTLSSPYLPENPYNMIGRLLLHDCIFENIRAYYSMLNNSVNKKGEQEIFNMGEVADQKKIMRDIKIGNVFYSVPWKLNNLIKQDRINALWPLLFEVKPEQKKKSSKLKKTSQISHCLGGSLILKIGSPYSAQQSLIPTHIVTIPISETMEHLREFADYIIDDCIKICESPNNIFIKLYVYTYTPASTEWSAENLIHNRVKIVKEIYKVCIAGLEEIKADYLMKVPAELVKVLGTKYVRVSRTYILVEQQGKQAKIHSIKPASTLLTSVFAQQSKYFQAITRSLGNKGSLQQIVHQMQAEQHSNIIYSLQKQQPAWTGWCLYYISLYDFSENRSKEKQLRSAITFMMDSPLGFIDTLRHEINTTKLMSSRSSSTNYEAEIIELLQRAEKKIVMYIQKQEHIYPETVLFFQAVHRNLQLILEQQEKKNKNIKPILERIQFLFKYLLNSFYQICFVLKGHLLNEIVKIDNEFGKDGSGEIISNTVTYDIFLRKYKDLPDRTLNIQQEISKFRQEFMRPDNDIRELILAKYVQQYRLYQQIYEFYWGIICGKKMAYPMGQFVTRLRNQAIRFDSQVYKNNKKLKFDIEQTKTDGIMIYQKAADARGEHLFYALSADALQDESVNTFRTIKQIFEEYFQNDLISQKSIKSLSHLQKNSYIISISTEISRLKTEQSDFNKCKIYVDSIYNVPINPTEIYRIMYDEIMEKIDLLEKNGFGVIGIYNGDKEFLDEDQVSAWIQCDQKYDVNFLRFQPKKPITAETVAKLLKTCKTNNSQVLIRGVFWLNGLLKSCEISLNFLINKEWLLNLAHTYKARVFSKHEQIARWGNYNGLKQYIQSHKKIRQNPNFNKRESLKERYLSNHIDLIQFVAEDMQNPLQIAKVRTYSPFYTQLEQSLSLVESLFYMLQYVKIDRYGKFQVKDLKNTIEILEYYLFDKCLRMDRYIYSEGLSVTIINMVSRFHRYLEQHPDNNGEQRQLIYLQKISVKLMNCIHYVLTSCAFGVIEAITNEFIKPNDSDSDDD